MRIVVAGGSGFLGTALVRRLNRDGHSTAVLTRTPRTTGEVKWDPYGSQSLWAHALNDADAVVNLAGASIAKRWTAAYKREIWSSRVEVTRTIVAAMQSVASTPAALLNASAVGIYGARGEEPLTEDSTLGSGFLASLGREWEDEALAAGPRIRVVLLRSGIPLDRSGGALPQMALPFRFFVGGPIGSGRQYFSWIHLDDWTAMVSWALTTSGVSGPLNVTSPHPVTNSEFTRTLARMLRRPAVMRVPAIALRVVVGEMAGELVTGQRVLPQKARSAGFTFAYPELEGALREIYGRV